MFSALTQGSIIYILDKTDGFKYSTGEVVGVSAPHLPYSSVGPTVDLKVNINGLTQDFNLIPGGSSLVTYNNGKLVISETKQGLLSEVESILQNSKLILDNIDTYKQNISTCELILKEINPLFAKNKLQEERLSNLESKIDLLLTLISDKK